MAKRFYNWTQQEADDSSPHGSNGTGYSQPYAHAPKSPHISRTPHTTGTRHVARMPHSAPPVVAARSPFVSVLPVSTPAYVPTAGNSSDADWSHSIDKIRDLTVQLVKRAVGTLAFNLGAIVGLLESLWGLVKGLYDLGKLLDTLLLAIVYAWEEIAKLNHIPVRVVDVLFGVIPPMTRAAMASPEEKRNAYESIAALMTEVKSFVTSLTFKKACQLTGKKWDEVVKAWNEYGALLDSGEPGKMYKAGEISGKVAGEVIMTIFAAIGVARKLGLLGKAARLAAAAAAAAEGEVELNALIRLVEAAKVGAGDAEVEGALQELKAAAEELKSARASGNAGRVAAAKPKFEAATKKLEDIVAKFQEGLKKEAPKLKEAAEDIKEKPKKQSRAGGQESPPERPKNREKWRTEPDPKRRGSKPRGRRTTNTRNESPAKKRSIELENDSAARLADAGYDVEQNPDVSGKKNPDYKINGEIFDNYAPRESTSARNIVEGINDKVGEGQADRIVLNLADSNVTRNELRAALSEFGTSDLKEIIMIDRDGNIVRFYP